MDVVEADTMVPVQSDHQQREEIGNASAGGSFETTAGNNSSHAQDSTDQTSLVGMEEEGAASDGVKTTPIVNKTRKGLSNKAGMSSEGSCRDGSNLQEDWVVDEGEKSQYSDVEEKENGSADQNKVGLEKAVEGGDLKMREKYAGGKRTKRGGPGSEDDGSLAPGRTTAVREARNSCSPPLSPAASASCSNYPSDAGSRSDHRSSGHGGGDDENVIPADRVEDDRGRRNAHENSGPGGRVARREERREDPADVVEELTGALDKLLEIEETMTLHRGYAPDNLQKNIGISPRLWDEIYEKARIIPSRGNRLYRSRVRRLVTYLERRLNLPTRLLPYPEEQRREMQEYARGRSSSPARRPSRGQGPRDAGDRRDFERRLPSVDRQARGRPGQEENSRHRVDPLPPRKPAGVDAGASRVAKQMECEEVTPFVAIRNLSRDLAFSDLLRLLQSHAPTYKIQAADLLLRPSGGNGRREGFVAYLSMANVTLAERLREGVRGIVFEGQRLSTGYTLGVPCADVYVDGVEEMEEEEVAALMQRWGQVVRVTGVKGTPKERHRTSAFVTFANVQEATEAVKAINDSKGAVKITRNSFRSMKATFRPFKGRSFANAPDPEGTRRGREAPPARYERPARPLGQERRGPDAEKKAFDGRRSAFPPHASDMPSRGPFRHGREPGRRPSPSLSPSPPPRPDSASQGRPRAVYSSVRRTRDPSPSQDSYSHSEAPRYPPSRSPSPFLEGRPRGRPASGHGRDPPRGLPRHSGRYSRSVSPEAGPGQGAGRGGRRPLHPQDAKYRQQGREGADRGFVDRPQKRRRNQDERHVPYDTPSYPRDDRNVRRGNVEGGPGKFQRRYH